MLVGMMAPQLWGEWVLVTVQTGNRRHIQAGKREEFNEHRINKGERKDKDNRVGMVILPRVNKQAKYRELLSPLGPKRSRRGDILMRRLLNMTYGLWLWNRANANLGPAGRELAQGINTLISFSPQAAISCWCLPLAKFEGSR